MNRLRYVFSLLSVASFLLLLVSSIPAHADEQLLNVNDERNSLYSSYDSIKKEIFRKHGALNPDGTVNKNAPGYGDAVGEARPHHKQMMEKAGRLGDQRETINQKIYEQAGAKKPRTTGTDSQKGGGRGGFGDAEGTAQSVEDYERIAKGFKKQGYHVDRQPDYIKIDKLDTVIHRPAGSKIEELNAVSPVAKTDAVGSSAHEARVTAQTHGPETGGSASGQNKYQGQGGQYAAHDKMGSGLDSIKKIQDAVNADPRTPWEKYQRDQVMAKETNRIRNAAGMQDDPHLELVKQGMDPDLMPEIRDPVKQKALDQARSAWPKIEENHQKNLADLDQAISTAKTPAEAHKLTAEKNDILRRQEGTRNAIFEKDGGKAFTEITGKGPEPGKPLSETTLTKDKPATEPPAGEPGKTVKTGGEPAAGGKETVKVKKPDTPEAPPGKSPGLFDNHPVEKNIKPYFSGKPGKVTEVMETHGGKITLVLTAAQTLNCLAQGKSVGQCAMELVEGAVTGSVAVLVLGPTGVTILGGVLGAYQIYEGGVEATKQWADARQRSAAYENRDKQTTYNLEQIDRYINDFREKKIYGELQVSSAAVSDACRAVESQVRSAAEGTFDQSDDINDVNFAVLLSAIRTASASCTEAAFLMAEIADLQSKSKPYEDTIIKGLEWARSRADTCGSAEDANKIRDMFTKCTSLAASIEGFSAIAKEKNARITLASDKGSEATIALTIAKAMNVKIITKAASTGSIKNTLLPQIESAVERKNTHSARSSAILGEIDQLRKGFPDTLLPVNEAKFNELRGLVEKYRELTCNPESMDWLKRLDNAKANLDAHAQDTRKSLEEATIAASACRNITPSDQAVEALDASANWVLTAIGMNEDLPQKAVACLAKFNVHKESRLAAVTCPANSTSVWNEQTKEAQCQCGKGFKWNDAHTACLEKAAQMAVATCKPGSEAYWNEEMNSARCRCTKGLKWNQERTACVADREAQAAATKCWPGSETYWDEATSAMRCRCAKGLTWNNERNACIIDKAAQVAAADCSKSPNSRPYWDEKENRPRCTWCNPGHTWKDSSSLECVSDKAAQVAAADCSGTPNSRPYWDSEQNSVRCKYCYDGYHWRDGSGIECVANDSGTGNNGSGGINFGQIFEQINTATQKYNDDTTRKNNNLNKNQRNVNLTPTKAGNKTVDPYCDNYAKTAVSQYQTSVSRNCGYSDRRWQGSYDNHYGWCLKAGRKSAENETSGREKGMQECSSRGRR